MTVAEHREYISYAAFFGAVAVFGFLFNFFWETMHGAFLYVPHWKTLLEYVALITRATLGDVMYLFIMYGGGVLLWRSARWTERLALGEVAYIVLAGSALAIFIEYRGVFLNASWSYGPLMPTVFGFGLSPLVQLAATGLVTFFIAERYARGVVLRART